MSQLLVELGEFGFKKGLRNEKKMKNYLNSKILKFLNIEQEDGVSQINDA